MEGFRKEIDVFWLLWDESVGYLGCWYMVEGDGRGVSAVLRTSLRRGTVLFSLMYTPLKCVGTCPIEVTWPLLQWRMKMLSLSGLLALDLTRHQPIPFP